MSRGTSTGVVESSIRKTPCSRLPNCFSRTKSYFPYVTLLVVAAAYGVMEWERLQVLVLAFPESLMLVVAAFLIAGRWVGMRLTELFRFRDFLTPSGAGPGTA